MQVAGKIRIHQGRDIRGPRDVIHGDHGRQHEDRTDQRIEEELETGINPVSTAPDPDDQEHRNQARFKEQIEQNHIQGTENTNHQRFHKQEGNHIFPDPGIDRFPAGQDTERHQESGQDDKQHGDTVDPHMVVDATTEPFCFFNKLETCLRRVKINPDQQGYSERRQCGPEGHMSGVTVSIFLLATCEQDQQGADNRHKGHQG